MICWTVPTSVSGDANSGTHPAIPEANKLLEFQPTRAVEEQNDLWSLATGCECWRRQWPPHQPRSAPRMTSSGASAASEMFSRSVVEATPQPPDKMVDVSSEISAPRIGEERRLNDNRPGYTADLHPQTLNFAAANLRGTHSSSCMASGVTLLPEATRLTICIANCIICIEVRCNGAVSCIVASRRQITPGSCMDGRAQATHPADEARLTSARPR